MSKPNHAFQTALERRAVGAGLGPRPAGLGPRPASHVHWTRVVARSKSPIGHVVHGTPPPSWRTVVRRSDTKS